jgi:N-acyl-D-aspartate/D-glutamate deacylase
MRRQDQILRLAIGLALFAATQSSAAQVTDPNDTSCHRAYDLVIARGRVIDPETDFDAIRYVGLCGDKVAAISTQPLSARDTIDAAGLVVAPGFIDLHWHGQRLDSYWRQAHDGVTSSFELEVGSADVDRWYAERANSSVIHHGVAIGHIPLRMAVMGDDGEFLPRGPAAFERATDAQLAEIKARFEYGLKRGAVAAGFGIAYTARAAQWEILELFRIAARYHASVHVHIRGASSASGSAAEREPGLTEVIAAAAITGAPVHIVHVQSSGQQATARFLSIIEEVRGRGLDISTECYPYTAGATRLESFLFDDWVDRPAQDYQKLQWAASGERLTRESFLRYRADGGLVLIHANSEDVVRAAVRHPLTMIASDGFDIDGRAGHPRSAGTFSRVLGKHVREWGDLDLKTALAKMTLMPANRLRDRVPNMAYKGRLRVGADADIAIFDAETIADLATYETPGEPPKGMHHVIVGGQAVIRNGAPVLGRLPGRPIRAALEP